MSDSYLWFVLAAYGVSAFALSGLGLWIGLDARATRRRLAALDAGRGVR